MCVCVCVCVSVCVCVCVCLCVVCRLLRRLGPSPQPLAICVNLVLHVAVAAGPVTVVAKPYEGGRIGQRKWHVNPSQVSHC